MADDTIPVNYRNGFKEGFEMAFQQSQSKLRPLVTSGSQASEFDFYDRVLLADDMNEVTTRLGDTPSNEVPHERRRIGLRDFDWGKGIEKNDIRRVGTDPTNAYTMGAVMAANRKIDSIITDAITGTSYAGKGGGTSIDFVSTASGKITVGALSNENGNITTAGNYAVTSGNYEGVDVAVDYVPTGSATNSNLTIDKLIAARETALAMEAINEGDLLPLIVSPSQQSALLRISEVKSFDYNSNRVLENGFVTQFMGFRIIYYNGLPKTGNIRDCYILGPRGVRLAIGEDINPTMFLNSAKKNRPWVMVEMSMGATRMWGEHTIRIKCDETK